LVNLVCRGCAVVQSDDATEPDADHATVSAASAAGVMTLSMV
jgi:hypothetical protein